MKKFILAALMLVTACGRPETINPLQSTGEDYKITEPGDCVYSTEVDPKGMYYNVQGFLTDGMLATSEVSCDDTYVQWLKLKKIPVVLLRA
jgi:hypothetical protein